MQQKLEAKERGRIEVVEPIDIRDESKSEHNQGVMKHGILMAISLEE